MRQTTATLALLALVSALPAEEKGRAAAAGRPNILLIMADDMGYSDIGCYGGEIHTPNLDKLAAGGIRFTQFYNTGRCCPTRASLMTGLYPHQAGIGWMMKDQGLAGYRGDLNTSCRTIAEVLRPAGYATYMSGKWHVTKKIKPAGPADKHNWPRQRGFDRFFGTIHGAGSYFDPNTLTLDNTFITPGKDFYYTDAITDHAAKFINEHKGDQPFFLYVAFTAPHWPMHAKPADMRKYKGRYDSGWDALRAERYARMVKMGLVDPRWGLSPRDPRVPKWEDAKLKEWHARRREVYAAMVDCLDQGVGRIVEALKKSGRYEDTLIFFLADNGGCAEEVGSTGPITPDPKKKVVLRPMKPGELQTQMIPTVTRDGRPVRRGRGVMPGPADTFVAYGRPWANASNTPFRLYKHFVHEGGISSPLIIHWPRGIPPERHNTLERQPGHLIDVMATCVDVAGAKYPDKVDGKPITPMQGVSLRPTFTGKELKRGRPLFWEHEGNRAMREGKWKLVARGARGKWELYDMKADRSELHDLAGKYPERTERMARRWEEWAVAAKVKPWPYDKKK
jgi:arylsulfatase A-like enzyme